MIYVLQTLSLLYYLCQHWIACHSQATWFRYPTFRYWRKNVAALNGTQCLGVDLNRNFDVNWSQVNSQLDYLLCNKKCVMQCSVTTALYRPKGFKIHFRFLGLHYN